MTAFNHKIIIGSGLVLTGMSVGHATTVAHITVNTASQKPPNVLVIMADDLGFSDISPYGGEIETPNLQILAENGMSFTDFSVTPYSAPSRAAFLTGSDPHKVGVGNLLEISGPEQKASPNYVGHLNEKAVTIAERLKQAGYFTVMSGKWHLGKKTEEAPTNWGFDEFFGLLKGEANHFKRANYPEGPYGPELYRLNGEMTEIPDNFYSSTTYTDYLIDSLDKRPEGKPFFAYLQFTAPHSPLQAPREDIEKYSSYYQDGPRALAEQRFKNAKKLNLIPTSAKQPMIKGYPKWDSFSEEDRQKEIKRMQIYAAMVDNMDANIGRIVDNLKAIGELDNTYIFFFSDNGAAGKYSELGPWKEWVNNDHDNSLANMGNFDSYVSMGIGWAQASNMPFSLFKGYTAEGGIRSPLIVSGPNIPKTTVSGRYSNLTDLAPTILDIAGVAKTTPKGKAPLDGQTLLPVLMQHERGNAQGPYTPKMLEMNGSKMVRLGDFKALANTDKLAGLGHVLQTQKWQLYNLAQDPGETTNIADKYPAILDSMIADYNDYAKNVGVVEVSPSSK